MGTLEHVRSRMPRAARRVIEGSELKMPPGPELMHFPCLQGESPLHTACRCGLAGLTAELLQQGANPNLQTQKPLPDDAGGVAMQSPLHMAIAHNHPDVVSVILEQKGRDSGTPLPALPPPNFLKCTLSLFPPWVRCSQCSSCHQQPPDHSRLQSEGFRGPDGAGLGPLDR